MADLHGTDVKNSSAAVRSTEPRTLVQVKTVCDGHDEHQQCETDINAVGRTEGADHRGLE